MSSLSILEALKRSADFLQGKEIATSRLDAEVLLAHGLGTTRLGLYTHFDQPLTQDEMERCRELVRERGKRVPVAYLTGLKEFMGIDLRVNSCVLIPRPDTETLVTAALSMAGDPGPDAWVLDVGTGSGCVGISLVKLLGMRTLGIDISLSALNVARDNARSLDQEGLIQFAACDLLEGLGDLSRFRVVVANLPYVPGDEIAHLAPEVSRYEPRLALNGGTDGLELIRRFARSVRGRIRPGSVVLLEVGFGQADEVRGLMSEAGFCDVALHRDLGGIDRVVSGRMGGV